MKRDLRAKWDTLTPKERDEYMQLDVELESLLDYIFEKRE